MLIVLMNQVLVLEPRAVESCKIKHSLTGGSGDALCVDGEAGLREADTVGARKPPVPGRAAGHADHPAEGWGHEKVAGACE